MAKSKSKALIMAADGTGGLTQVEDRRFEEGDWPIRFEVPNLDFSSTEPHMYVVLFRRQIGNRVQHWAATQD